MSFHYHLIQLSRNTLRVFAPRGRTLATTAGTTTKIATLHRCPCARAQTSITSLVANGASATYGKNNQILQRELLSLRLIRLKALVFHGWCFFLFPKYLIVLFILQVALLLRKKLPHISALLLGMWVRTIKYLLQKKGSIAQFSYFFLFLSLK